jgi:hypothetical protein
MKQCYNAIRLILLFALFVATSQFANAQVVFQAYSSNTGEGNTVSVPKVTGTALGDFLLLSFSYEKGSDVNLAVTSNGFTSRGWTLIRRSDNSGKNIGVATFYKIATANEVGAGNIQSITVNNGPKWSITLSRLSGVHATTPIQISAIAS